MVSKLLQVSYRSWLEKVVQIFFAFHFKLKKVNKSHTDRLTFQIIIHVNEHRKKWQRFWLYKPPQTSTDLQYNWHVDFLETDTMEKVTNDVVLQFKIPMWKIGSEERWCYIVCDIDLWLAKLPRAVSLGWEQEVVKISLV